MKIKYFSALSLLLTSTASFSGENVWDDDGIDSEFGPFVRATIFRNSFGVNNVGIIFPSDECNGFDSELFRAPSYKVNGTLVKIYAQCISEGMRMDFPATNAGRSYVINQFKSKNVVIYSQDKIDIKFSAKGFLDVFNSYGSNMEGI